MKISASSAGEDIICLGNPELKIQHSEFLTNRKKRNEIAQIETNQKRTHSVLHIIIYFRTLQLIKQKNNWLKSLDRLPNRTGRRLIFLRRNHRKVMLAISAETCSAGNSQLL